MTSRLTLGGNEQSAGSHYGRDTQPDFKFHTYAYAAYELAPSLVPQAVKVLPSVARSAQQEDRALFSLMSDALFVVGVVVAAMSCPVAIIWAGYICFFMKT